MEENKTGSHKAFKKSIEEWFSFFKDNNKRYKQSMRFAFKETLSEEERQILEITHKPPIEINYIQAFLSKLLGEFSKHASEVSVSGNGRGQDVNVATVEIVEGHIRDIFDQFKKKGYVKQVFKEQCGGGFSVLEVFTDYTNNESFEQYMGLRKSDDPVMCFFDPMAKLPSKSDGKYCGKIYPMTKDEFKKQYSKYADKAEHMSFDTKNAVGENSPFSWSYHNMSVDIVLLAEVFQVEYKNRTLFELSDRSTMKESEYNAMVKDWDSIEPPPDISNRRKIKDMIIKRYVLFGEDILEKEQTSFPGLPYVFVDGDSAFIYRNDIGGEIEQVIHSYIHNAMDAQRLLNYTYQTIANFSENLMQQKYIIDERAIVDPDSWTNPQKASLLIKKSIDEEGNPIPDPVQPVHQADLPPSIMNTANQMQQVLQNTLGSYDAQMGVNRKYVSGEAIEKGDIQNNAVSIPFRDGFDDAVNTVAELFVKMIPKYYITPTTMPYMDEEGERSFIKVNQLQPDGSNNPEYPMINYGENDLDIKVTSSHSFAIQKDKSLSMIIQLMKAIPSFAGLMDEKGGLPIILDNLDIRGIDKLKKLANDAAEKAEQQPNQPNPIEQQMMLKKQELAQKERQAQINAQIKMKEIEQKERQLVTEKEIAELNFQKDLMNDVVQHEKAQAEITTHRADNEAKLASNAARLADHVLKREAQQHNHAVDLMKHSSRRA